MFERRSFSFLSNKFFLCNFPEPSHGCMQFLPLGFCQEFVILLFVSYEPDGRSICHTQ